MPLPYWIMLWKAVFIIGIGLFSVLAVVVTIGGARDVRKLLRSLREEHRESRETDSAPGESR